MALSEGYRRVGADRFRPVARRVSKDAALLFAHLLIGRAANSCGIVELDVEYLRLDLRDGDADPDALAQELASVGALVCDWQNRIAYICGWLLDDAATNDKHWKGIVAAVVKRCPNPGPARGAALQDVLLSSFSTANVDSLCKAYREAIDSLSEASPPYLTLPVLTSPIRPSIVAAVSAPPVADAPALELFPAPKAEPKLRTVAQKPPTEDEVIAYFASKGAPRSEAVKFRGYYQGNGWRVGKNPMKSWHGCVATWIGNWQERGGVLREPSLSPPIHDSTVSPRTDEEIDASTAERERTYQAWRDHQAKLRAAQ